MPSPHPHSIRSVGETVGPHVIADDSVRGLLFDCDGTLLDSMPLFLFSWYEVCPKFGLKMTEDDFYGFAGMPLPDIVRSMHRSQLGSEASDDFVAGFLTAKQEAHAKTEGKVGPPKPIGCVVALAREAAAAGVPMCIATSGLRVHIEAHIASAGLSDLFSPTPTPTYPKGNIVCAADVAHGKPAADIFEEAARLIGVEPRLCRAYEDGESGLQSAHAAGCHVVDVTGMEGYPSCDGLRRAKWEAARTRSWLSTPLSKAQKRAYVGLAACVCGCAVAYDRRFLALMGIALMMALRVYTAFYKADAKAARKTRKRQPKAEGGAARKAKGD